MQKIVIAALGITDDKAVLLLLRELQYSVVVCTTKYFVQYDRILIVFPNS